MRSGDEWVPATVFMFSLRWLLLIPAVALLPVVAVLRRRALVPLVLALAVIVGPVMGLCIPIGAPSSDATGAQVRVLTCNLHHAPLIPGSLESLIASDAPDVIALQEWQRAAPLNKHFPTEWYTVRSQSHFLASRYPIRNVAPVGNDSSGEQVSATVCEVELPDGPVALLSLHFASPREALNTAARNRPGGWDAVDVNTRRRWSQSFHVAAAAEEAAARTGGRVLIVGDFNTPPESTIFRRVWGGYEDAFSVSGWGWGYTFFETRRTAVRIDHILVGKGGRAIRCRVGPNIGSPHLPVIADVCWP